jgi:hypothetical protein
MIVDFEDIVFGFDYVSAGPIGENEAYLNNETGKIIWHTEMGDNFEELPDDLDDEKYIEIPHKSELGLGKPMAIDFAYEKLPDKAETIESFFRKRGAYPKFKSLLEDNDMLDQWYEFELQAQNKELREWCEENEIDITD